MSEVKDFSVEIYCEQIKGWVVLSLSQFFQLGKQSRIVEQENEIHLNNICNPGLEMRFNHGKSEEKIENLKVGDFVEVEKNVALSLNLCLSNRTTLFNTSTDQLCTDYNVWSRERIISHLPDSHEYLVMSCLDSNINKVPSEKIRLLQESDIKDFIENNYLFKRIEINNEYSNLDQIFYEILSQYPVNDLFYAIENDDDVQAINLISQQVNILFYYNLLMIKLEISKNLVVLENKIKEKQGSLEKINKIIEDENTQCFKFRKEFQVAIETKILESIKQKEGLNYLILKDANEDQIRVLIFGTERVENLTCLKESIIELEPKLAKWLLVERMSNLNKIVENTKIVIII